MVHRTMRVQSLFLAILAGLLVSTAMWAQKPASHTVVGTYSIVQTTDLDEQVRVELRLELVNSGEEAVTARVLGLESPVYAAQGGSSAGEAIALSSHGSETVTEEFTVSRGVYERWRMDPRHRLVVSVESPAGVKQALTIAMRRMAGGKGL